MDAYLALAKKTVETYIKTGKIIDPPKNLPEEMLLKKAGTFVSIHKKSTDFKPGTAAVDRGQPTVDQLRGCIGTFLPTKENIAYEIISNAISACSKDIRFSPIREEELKNLHYSVDILSKPEPVSKIEDLDPKKYGILVKSENGKTGLLLPDLEGVDRTEKQLAIACTKAGINPKEGKISIFRFEVERHKE
jgi:AmmeMemoRadiSam system protein A